MMSGLQTSVATILVAAAGAMFVHEVARRIPTSERTAVQEFEQRGCHFYRFIDRTDSAYFQVSCRKPMPDSIVFLPARVR